MDFNQVIQEYNRLLGLYQNRQITEQAFQEAVRQLTATDAWGRFWHFDPNTGQWMRFENGQWLRDTPPVQTPAPPAFPPQAPAGYGYPPAAPKSNKTLWIILSVIFGLAVIVLIVLLATGTFNPIAAPTPTAAPIISSATPTKVVQASPTLAPSLVAPTKTLPPTLVPTLPKPTNTPAGGLFAYLAPGVHYLLYGTETSVFLVQPDTKTVQLNQDDLVGPDSLRAAISPRSGLVAFITSSDTSQMTDMTLHVVRLSDTKELIAIPLTNAQTEPAPNSQIGDASFQSVIAITMGNLSWSDNGQMLAFIGAMDGASTDVYLLDLTTLKYKRMSSEPSFAFSARISPDGKNIVFFGASTFGTGAGFSMTGVWVVPASGGTPVELYKPTTTEEFIGWVSSTKFAVQSISMVCGAHNLRQINITTKVNTPLIETCFQNSALDPKTSAIMAATNTSLMTMCNCGKKVDPGLYFISPTVPLKQVDKGDFDNVWWASGPEFFTGIRSDRKLTAVDTAGKVITLPTNIPLSEAQGNQAVNVWAGNKEVGSPGLHVRVGAGNPSKLVFNDNVADLTFNADLSALFFISGDKLYVAPVTTWASKSVISVPGASSLALAIQQ